MKTLALAALAAVAFAATPAAADNYIFGYSPSGARTISLDGNDTTTNNSGWFDQTGYHASTNDNYITGALSTSVYRNFFTFSVPTGTYSSAILTIANDPGSGFFSDAGPFTWTLYDVGQALDTNISYSDVSIFNDLGSGTVFGSATISGPTSAVTVTLNAAGLASVNAAAGGLWTVGGSTTAGAVPEPASWAMMIAGFGLVGAAMRRRTAAVAA